MQAIKIEQELLKESVGSQDQIASSFGGINTISFNKNTTFEVDPIILSQDRIKELQDNLLLCFTGFARNASNIAKKQILITPKKEKELTMLNDLCKEALNILTNKNHNLDLFGKYLSDHWKIKKELTDIISNNEIDEIYNCGINSGALGGKLLGAGGGGFMLFYAHKSKHK